MLEIATARVLGYNPGGEYTYIYKAFTYILFIWNVDAQLHTHSISTVPFKDVFTRAAWIINSVCKNLYTETWQHCLHGSSSPPTPVPIQTRRQYYQ